MPLGSAWEAQARKAQVWEAQVWKAKSFEGSKTRDLSDLKTWVGILPTDGILPQLDPGFDVNNS